MAVGFCEEITVVYSKDDLSVSDITVTDLGGGNVVFWMNHPNKQFLF